MQHHLTTPLTSAQAQQLKSGDTVLLSGTIYTARDAAHKRLCEALERGEVLPLNLQNAVIYYAGPTPARPGEIIGSCGPTTSGRMDAYAPTLMRQGVIGMIGKGARSAQVVEAMKECGAVYFAAIGGAGAVMASCVKQAEVVCYDDLGSEAVRRLTVENMPLTVIIDNEGHNLYEDGPAQYLAAQKQEEANA